MRSAAACRLQRAAEHVAGRAGPQAARLQHDHQQAQQQLADAVAEAPQRAQQRALHVAPPDRQRRQRLQPPRPPRSRSGPQQARRKLCGNRGAECGASTGASLGGQQGSARLGRFVGTRHGDGRSAETAHAERTARWSGPDSVCRQPATRPAPALRTADLEPAANAPLLARCRGCQLSGRSSGSSVRSASPAGVGTACMLHRQPLQAERSQARLPGTRGGLRR